MTSLTLKPVTAVVLLAATVPAAAQTSEPSAVFDGSYQGVSRERFKSTSDAGSASYCTLDNNHPPSPLVVANGTVRSLNSRWQGTISPQGWIVLHDQEMRRMDARVDGQGTIRGQISGIFCSMRFVWRRQAS